MQFKKLLVANRGEIAIRVMRAATELGLQTVAVYAAQDKLSLHRFKADEAYLIGAGLGPITAYLSIEEVLRVASHCGADAIHPGYGFLSENPDFAQACADAGISFIGPTPETMRLLGNKLSARALAQKVGTPVIPATSKLPDDLAVVRKLAADVGYPLMLKASWGGGGRGMRIIESESELETEVLAGRREAAAAFGNDEMYLEKLIRRAQHVEVQLLGDSAGNLVHLFERDCTVQRRNQKIVERAPAPYLSEPQRQALCEAALNLARAANYVNAGTAEFLLDSDTGKFYFIEVNPRIQVEHTVTEQVTGVDLVKAQIQIAAGALIGEPGSGIPAQSEIKLSGHAIQCRITTEDPESNFIPDYGRITAYRGATGFGIRLDGGTAYSGAVITRYYDSLLEKVTAWAPDEQEVIARMDRALREFRIRGVATNLAFLQNLINHPKFRSAQYTTRFIDQTPELFEFPRRRDRATRLLRYIAEITVNGHPGVKNRPSPPAYALTPVAPELRPLGSADGPKKLLDQQGPRAVADWLLHEKRVHITDTTMRDAHQSLLATRMRTYDMAQVAAAYSANLPGLFSLECWGGATFDVAMRFLDECPWERLRIIREKVPNILLQMLIRGANGVGYTNYPDNVVQSFIRQAAQSGMDLFRVFDSLNWVENMRVAIDAVLDTGKICEATICYSGDLLDPARSKYDLRYYCDLARQLADAGTHILGIKDMAGLVKPEAARVLIKALKEETGLPVHFHTHDTSGIAAASVLAAVEAGADAVDAAMDSFSGLTSQPNLGSIVEALRRTDRETGLDPAIIREISDYWEAVRVQYSAFESDLRAGASEVYLHEMPGGQFTNLKEQARALGLADRWHQVARAYAEVNLMFGDIIKVTPSSKVVGDMALTMVSSGLTRAQVEDPEHDVAFPESVVNMFRGQLGQPHGGFPKALQRKILKGEQPLTERPGATLAAVDLSALRLEAERTIDRKISDEELNSYLMYPKVFTDYAARRRQFGPVSILPTPVFFYGMAPHQEIAVDLQPGKTLNILCQTVAEPDEHGDVQVFFELNGQPRTVKIADRSHVGSVEQHPKADPDNANQVPAPMPGLVVSVAVQKDQAVKVGDVLLVIEAMKMETTLHADRDGMIKQVSIQPGANVEAKDLLIEYAE